MFFNRKHKITKDAYGKVILSKFILKSGENYFDLMKEFDLELDFTNYLFYLQYLLYIAHKILRIKYSLPDTSIIVNSSIGGIIDLLDDIDSKSKPQLKETFRECYWDFFSNNDVNIFAENDMHKLVDLFLENCEYEKAFEIHYSVFVNFTLFIKYHTGDILNKQIKLI